MHNYVLRHAKKISRSAKAQKNNLDGYKLLRKLFLK